MSPSFPRSRLVQQNVSEAGLAREGFPVESSRIWSNRHYSLKLQKRKTHEEVHCRRRDGAARDQFTPRAGKWKWRRGFHDRAYYGVERSDLTLYAHSARWRSGRYPERGSRNAPAFHLQFSSADDRPVILRGTGQLAASVSEPPKRFDRRPLRRPDRTHGRVSAPSAVSDPRRPRDQQ